MKLIAVILLFLPIVTNANLFPDNRAAGVLGKITGVEFQRKFGINPDVDTSTLPEDIWVVGGVYVFPTVAATTTIVSDSTDDASGGSGCRSILVSGLDGDFLQIQEAAVINGTSVVTLSNQFLRISRMVCTSSGATETNAGNIDVKHGATVLGRIPPNKGLTQQMIFTVPANKTWLIDKLTVSLEKKTAGACVVEIQVKPFSTGTWQTINSFGLTSVGSSNSDQSPPPGRPFAIPGKTDIRVRITEADASDLQVTANAGGFLINSDGSALR